MSYKELAATISHSGVAACFGIPGSGASLNLIDELERVNIPFYLTHFEGSGAVMAATAGHISDTVGLSISIKGPGLLNALPGIAAAWFEAFPLIHVAEATPDTAPPWVAHKRLPQQDLCSVVTKSDGYLSYDPECYEAAVKIATCEEPAPVLMQIGEGEAPVPVDMIDLDDKETNFQDVWKSIAKCENPILIVGAFAARQGLGMHLVDLKLPIFTTVAGKGIVDETKVHAAGVFTGVDQELTAEWNVFPKADFVISVGLSAREMLKVKKFSCQSLHVGSIVSTGLEGFGFDWFLGLEHFPELISKLAEKSWGEEIVARSRQQVEDKLTKGFLPGGVFQQIERHFSSKVRLVLDTGSFCTVGEHVWRAQQPDWFLASGQGRYMGTCLPMAIGAAIADQSVPTIAVMGDGSIGMYLSDIKLAVQHRLPILFILMTDGGFGSIRISARKNSYGFSPIQVDGRSWVDCVNGLGVSGDRVETAQSFENALKAWIPGNGPAFIEIGFDPDQYETMVMGVRS